MRFVIKILCLYLFTACSGSGQSAPYKVLIFSYTAGFRHDSITNGIQTLQILAATNNFLVDTTEDPAQFFDANLAQYKVIIFLSTTGDVLTTADHTLTCGAYEAVAVGTPMVLSETTAIRSYFSKGAVYAAPTAQGIAAAIAAAGEQLQRLSNEVAQLAGELQVSWDLRFTRLTESLAQMRQNEYGPGPHNP